MKFEYENSFAKVNVKIIVVYFFFETWGVVLAIPSSNMRKVTLFLSVLTAIFPRKPELACLLELRTMVVGLMVTTGAIRRAKLQ